MNKENLPQLIATPRFLAFILLAPLLLAGVCQLVKAGQSLFFHGDNTFPEGAVVQTAVWSRDSGRVYPSLQSSPYTPAPYGPLFYVSLSAVARSTSAGFDSLLIFGRVVILISFLLLPMVSYRWARKRGLTTAFALSAAALVLAQIDFLDWNVTVRPDLLALLFSVVAFYLLTTEDASWRRMIVAGLLCGMAASFKQSFIALPFVAMVWLLWTRRLRNALWFAAGGATLGVVVVGWLAFHHEPFLEEVLLARYSPVSFVAAVQLLKADLLHCPWQMILLALGFLGALCFPKESLRGFLFLYLAFAWLAGFYTAMAPGANVNAFLEAWVVSAMLAPFAIYRLAESWYRVPIPAKAALVLLWLAAAAVSLEAWRVPMTVRPTATYGELAQIVRGHRVLSDFPYVSAHGAQPELLDPSVNHYLELARRWSPQPVLEEVKRQDFDFVIVGLSGGQPRQWRGLTLFSGSILREIASDYRLACASDRFAVYVPGSRATDSHSDSAATERRLQNLGCKVSGQVLAH
ncbi:MAG: glycosyltransferase family 39 protein [Terriglobales bacterium]